MKKKPFVKNNKVYLGGKKQKGGFIGGIGLGLAIPLLTKLLTGRGRRKKRGRRRRRRNNIVLVRRNAPYQVTLPNGRTFYAKFRRVTKECLQGVQK